MVDETHNKMLLSFVLTISLGILLSVDDVTSTSPVSVGSQLMSKYKNLGKSVSLYWTMYITVLSDIIKFSSVADKNRLCFKMAPGIPNFIGTVIPCLVCYLVKILLSEFHKLVLFSSLTERKGTAAAIISSSYNIWPIFPPTISTDFCNEKLIRVYFIVEKYRLRELEI